MIDYFYFAQTSDAIDVIKKRYKQKHFFSFISFRCLESGKNRRIKQQKYKRNSTGVFFYTD